MPNARLVITYDILWLRYEKHVIFYVFGLHHLLIAAEVVVLRLFLMNLKHCERNAVYSFHGRYKKDTGRCLRLPLMQGRFAAWLHHSA